VSGGKGFLDGSLGQRSPPHLANRPNKVALSYLVLIVDDLAAHRAAGSHG
jgi:hypothetical protein